MTDQLPSRLRAFALNLLHPRSSASIRSSHSACVVSLALLIDLALGDPANRWHPVAWMGGAIARARRRAPRSGAGRQFAYGLATALGGAASCALIGCALSAMLRRLPRPPAILAEAVVLKLMLSLRGLLVAGEAVRRPLASGDLAAARQQLSWHLVSRDTSALDKAQVAAATVESLAENASDGVVAPLMWYAVGGARWGLAGTLAYRFLNTADAMLGYRDAEREWLGKSSARLDDVANWLPARLTAALLVAAAPLVGGDAHRAWHIWRRDATLTASPNAGHPMSAAAGALGVALEKVGQYTLGAGMRAPDVADIRSAQKLVAVAVALFAGAATFAVMVFRQRQSVIPAKAGIHA